MPAIALFHRRIGGLPWLRLMRAVFIVLLAVATLAFGYVRHGHAADDSLYRDLGEKAGITKIIDAAMENFLADPRIKDEFDNINIERLKGRLVDHFCVISGGPCQYAGRDMYAAHKGLHLNQASFNALAENVQFAMDKVGIPFRTQNRLVAILATMQRDVVTR
jgi:hemoglobin